MKQFTNGDKGMPIAPSYAGVTASFVLLTMSHGWLVWYCRNQPLKKMIVGNNCKTKGSINLRELKGN